MIIGSILQVFPWFKVKKIKRLILNFKIINRRFSISGSFESKFLNG